MREKIKKRTVSVVVFTLLISMLLITANAYYTDHHAVTNVFTTGNITIKLSEPEYNKSENKAKRDHLAPREEVVKDPYIINTGKSDCFVFAEVRIPRSNRIFVDSNGKKLPIEYRNLFTFTENTGWKVYSKTINDSGKSKYETYILSYSDGKTMKALKPKTSTTNLFKNNTLKFANVIEKSDYVKYEIPVKAYAIQTTDIAVSGNGKVSPDFVYKAISGQVAAERK